MSEHPSDITKHFDPAVTLAYDLLSAHVAAGNAETAALAKALEDLANVFNKHKVPADSGSEPQSRK